MTYVDGSDLERDVMMLRDALNDVWKSVNGAKGSPPEALAKAFVEVEAVARELNGIVRPELATALGDAMDTHQRTVEGVGTLKRHKQKNRTKWDKDALFSAVMDSRLATPDGEIVEETPVDKLLHVWNLPAPRVMALDARHIDADQFCAVEIRPGWTVEVIA